MSRTRDLQPDPRIVKYSRRSPGGDLSRLPVGRSPLLAAEESDERLTPPADIIAHGSKILIATDSDRS